MKPSVIKSMALICLGIAAVACLAALPARAANAPAAASAPPAVVLKDSDLTDFEKLPAAKQDAFVKEKAEEFKAMTPQERRLHYLKAKQAYDALPANEKAALDERKKKASAAYIASHKQDWEKNWAEEQKRADARTKEFIAKMPDYERAVLLKYKKLRETHSRDYAWHMILEEAGKGGTIEPVPAPEGKSPLPFAVLPDDAPLP